MPSSSSAPDLDALLATVPGGRTAVLTAALAAGVWLCREGLFYSLEKVVGVLQGQPARRARNRFLKDNFAPVPETATPVPLTPSAGALPPALAGVFLRNGPNDPLSPTGDFHWFDGAGLVHAVRIRPDGTASYASHLVQTARLAAEAKAGHPLYTKFGDHRGPLALAHMALAALRIATGVRPGKAAGEGTANTALAFTARRLLALHEGDLPYVLRVLCDGVIETLGRAAPMQLTEAASAKEGKGAKAPAAPGSAPLASMTAHPKQDAEGFYAISYRVDLPTVRYVCMDKTTGALTSESVITLPGKRGIMMHDFAIAGPWAVLLDVPLVFTPETMVKGGSSMPFTFRKDRPTRFGLLPKHGTPGRVTPVEPRWFTLPGPGVMIFHVANAHVTRDGKAVKLYACVFEEFDLDLDGKLARGDAAAAGAGTAGTAAHPDHYARLVEISLDLATGTASRAPLCHLPGDFPRVPESLTGKEARFAYVATMDPTSPVPLFSGVAKVDLRKAGRKDAVVAHIVHGPSRFGGECAFVPDPARRGEDAGFLVTYVHDESPEACAASPDGTGRSELVVYNAQSMGQAPVVVIPLPSRVPYGFHVHHMCEADVRAQAGRPWGVEAEEAGATAAREEEAGATTAREE